MQSNYKSISKYINNWKWKSKEERKNKNQAFPAKLGSVEGWVPTNPALAGCEPPSKAGLLSKVSTEPSKAGFDGTQPCWVRRNPALAGREPSKVGF
ncbi:hypothetical protein SLEP1_g55067 [Rubroshorea leprosula]|uniref:Uncharacterized protein n=1 Tax=Rubroshorea leprosula TaxID=152421 RepID=A0AAV5MEG7_9ROSI|nr:hypothetical protein SLEP1_g55067 [Rubroshorea leprosula]